MTKVFLHTSIVIIRVDACLHTVYVRLNSPPGESPRTLGNNKGHNSPILAPVRFPFHTRPLFLYGLQALPASGQHFVGEREVAITIGLIKKKKKETRGSTSVTHQ